MGRSANIITAVLVILILVILIGGVMFIIQQRNATQSLAAIPTAALIPTITPIPPTNTPFPTFPPTFTPIPSITATTTATTTVSPTVTITPTITDTVTPTPTPLQSDTPTPTSTFTPSPTSNIPSATPTSTRSPYPFTVRGGSIVFTQNTFNQQGCAFQAVAGQVLDLQDNALDGIQVVVTQIGGVERSARSGTATAYGPGGYEIPVDDQINGQSYVVQLRTPAGTELSEPYTVIFPSNCDQNIALIYWSQTRPF